MKRIYILPVLIVTALLVFTCRKEMVNPFDRECPPELWTPGSLTAKLETEGIVLNWELTEDHFDGYWIEVSADSLHWDSIHSEIIKPTQKTSLDTSLYPGSSIRYRIRGMAHLNHSNYCYSNKLKIPAKLPEVRTNEAEVRDNKTAILNGEVIDDGGTSMTNRGFYWSTSNSHPGPGDQVVIIDNSSNPFSFVLNHLQASTAYYFVAFASNSAGTATGEVRQFTTAANLTLPLVVTFDAQELTGSSARLSGEVNSDGGAAVSERGFCYSTSPFPDVDDIRIVSGNGTGFFTFPIENLEPATTYYVRAYALNSMGLIYGNEISFKTPETPCVIKTFVDPRDGKSYKTISLGNKQWMAENLAWLPEVSPSSEESSTEVRYYVYGYQGSDREAAKAKDEYARFGVLYNWPAAKTACPSGWHLPRDEEWKELEVFLGMSRDEADKTGFRGTIEGERLKAANGWNNYGNGNDEFCFSALPGGDRLGSGTFNGINNFGDWWSSDESSDSDALHRGLDYDLSGISRSNYSKELGFSVRCIKD